MKLRAIDKQIFSNVKDYDRWLSAVKAYEKANQWKPFSLERHIYHETFHSAEQDSSSLRYTINEGAYETPDIKATNNCLEKYFGQSNRVEDHTAWSVMQ